MAYPNESSQLVLYAVHDFEISPQDASTACAFLDDDIKLAAAQPFKYIVLVAGDLNRLRDGETKFYLDPSRQAAYMCNPILDQHNISTQARAFDACFSKLVELDTNKFSHFLQ